MDAAILHAEPLGPLLAQLGEQCFCSAMGGDVGAEAAAGDEASVASSPAASRPAPVCSVLQVGPEEWIAEFERFIAADNDVFAIPWLLPPPRPTCKGRRPRAR